MKRLHIITQPTAVADIASIDAESYAGAGDFRVERLEARRMRRFKRQFGWV
jgi:hypothetical protein